MACQPIGNALDTEEVEAISITINTKIDVPDYASSEDVVIELVNVAEKATYQAPMTGEKTIIDGVIPGIYSVNISGKGLNKDGELYYLNGGIQNHPILHSGDEFEVTISGGKLSPIVFKEIFYAGTNPRYFRNQFYELYNNSDHVEYLDGIYFCILHPGKAGLKLPIWPDEDMGKYVYSERLWKFPGTGKEYPLQPGESCVISQFAANHQLPIYSPNSPIDGSSSEFEFNMNNKNFPDQPACDMVHVFYDGKQDKGRSPQYLTSVFGAAYVIFRVPEGEEYDPVNNTSLQAKDMSSTNSSFYAKIPIRYVLDGVEAGDNETMLNAKRMPGVLDGGMTYVGDTYNSLGVARKKIGERPDGTPLLQDTNNSSKDFDRGVTPELRRYNSKMPSWNHTLK